MTQRKKGDFKSANAMFGHGMKILGSFFSYLTLVLGDVRKTSIYIDVFDVFFFIFSKYKLRRNSGNIFKKILITSRDVSNITILKLRKIFLHF